MFANCFSQARINKKTYIQPEYFFGRIIPNYVDTFPKTRFQQGFAINISTINTDTTSWARFYNYAQTGVMLYYANFDNNKVFGHQFAISPYILFPIFNHLKARYKVKLAAGVAHFSTFYNKFTNTTNQLIGSSFTWDFKVFLYRKIFALNNFNLFLGVGFSHESNGHAQLPNLGINSTLLTISGQFQTNKNNVALPKRLKGRNFSQKKLFFNYRQGVGFHEQSEAEGPKVGQKKPVYATSIAIGYTFNHHLKLRSGFTYKFYDQYYSHLINNNIVGLSDHPKLAASAFVFFVGNEFLMSHVSMDVELGVNLYKPFFKKYNPPNTPINVLMNLIATRVGINLYLINTNTLPKNNLFIGGNINANMAKADFTDFSIGYTHNFN